MEKIPSKQKEKIPAISPGLHRRIYGEVKKEPDPFILEKQKQALITHELAHLDPHEKALELPLPYWLKPVDVALQEATYQVLGNFMDELARVTGATHPPNLDVPYVPGWRKYEQQKWVPCDPPAYRSLVLDVETVNIAHETQPAHVIPVVCCAYAGPGEWLIWWNDLGDPQNMSEVVPFGGCCTIVGHNVGYDRAYLMTSYGPLDTNRYFDTRSAVVATRGLTNQQRPLYAKYKAKDPGDFQEGIWDPAWLDEATATGLADAIKHYDKDWVIEKTTRDGIWDGGLPYVQTHVADVAKYCFHDVVTTSQLLHHLLKPGEYPLHVPDFMTAGNILLARERLPVNPKIHHFYTRVRDLHNERVAAIAAVIFQLGTQLADRWKGIAPEDYDPWEKQLARLPMGKTKTKAYPEGRPLCGGDLLRSGVNKGRPRWYNLLCKDKDTLSLNQRVSVLILKIKYRDQPLEYVKIQGDQGTDEGWQAGGKWLIHPDNRKKRVIKLSLKGYSRHFERGIFTSACQDLNKAMQMARSTAISRSFLSRFQAIEAKNIGYGDFVIPCTSVMGAVSLRAQDSTFRVVKNPVALTPENKAKWKETGVIPPLPPSTPIGTSLLNHIEARPGWKFVLFDYAGQESKAAGLLANADPYGKVTQYAMDPFLRIQQVGSKADKTDIHSRVARDILGDVTLRDYGKVLVYALLYNQGVNSAAEFLLSVLPKMDEDTAKATARKFQKAMKGDSGLASNVFRALAFYGNGLLRPNLVPDLFGNLGDHTPGDRIRLGAGDPFAHTVPYTPLGTKISKGLWDSQGDFLTTRYNYVIQATCRAMLAIALLMFNHIASYYKIPHHLVFTIHDCIGYMVPDSFVERAALILCIAHKYSWAKLEKTLNIDTMAAIGLYPDEIEVDHIWRKKISDPVATPEYPDGVPQLGYTLTPAQLFDRFHSPEGLDGVASFKDDWLGDFDF